jgi:hypothetical protein
MHCFIGQFVINTNKNKQKIPKCQKKSIVAPTKIGVHNLVEQAQQSLSTRMKMAPA